MDRAVSWGAAVNEIKPAYMAVRGEDKPRLLGYFDTEEDAKAAYIAAVKQHFEERAKRRAQATKGA